MFGFSTDRDLLVLENIFFRDLHIANNILTSGSAAAVSGTTLTKTGEDFAAKGICDGCVIYLNDTTAGVNNLYEVVDCLSAEQLQISVLRANVNDDAIAPPAMTNADYRICSYQSLSLMIEYELCQYFDIAPGNAASEYSVEDLFDVDVLRQASVFAVLSALYSAAATATDTAELYWQKSSYYQRLFEKSRDKCKLNIDLGDDGIVDLTRYTAAPKLLRD